MRCTRLLVLGLVLACGTSPMARAAGADGNPSDAAVGDQSAEPTLGDLQPQNSAPVVEPAAHEADPAQTAMHPEPAPEASPPAAATTEPPAPAAAEAAEPPKIIATDDLIYLPVARFIQDNGKKVLAQFDATDRQVAVQFYTSRSGSTVWVSKTGYTDDAKSLFTAFAEAGDWGLSPADYTVPELKPSQDGAYSEIDLTNAEARVALLALEYARDARGGRIPDPPSQLGTYIDRKPSIFDRRTVLDTLAQVSTKDKAAYLESLQPKQPQFERLRQKLIALRKSSKEAEAIKIPDGPKLMPGKSHAQIALIRTVLKVSSPSVKADGTPADDTYYDDELARAVEAYKQKKGIEPVNPAITTALRRALNGGGGLSEWKLLANMEEWRWMPEDLGKYYVTVNIPEFKVRVVENGEVIHEERIVSGRVDTQTPIFSDLMRTVVIQPRWSVPDSIKIKELLPGLRGGGNPLARQGLVMEYNGRRIDAYNVDWSRTDIRNFNIYQPPGGGNALGVVKFLFPNKHAVYLHDTPSKSLFNESVRAFSHGCMRVRNPVKLADLVLGKDKGWDEAKVADLIANGPEENQVALSEPIPVHITYFTASVNDEGEVETFDDVYGHEKRITLALQGRWNSIVKADEKAVSPEDIPSGDGWSFGDSAFGDNFFGYSDDPRDKKKKKKGGGFFDQLFGGF